MTNLLLIFLIVVAIGTFIYIVVHTDYRVKVYNTDNKALKEEIAKNNHEIKTMSNEIQSEGQALLDSLEDRNIEPTMKAIIK